MRKEPTTRSQHDHCSHNRKEIARSKNCACFYCKTHFESSKIERWVGKQGDTALCPNCSIDAVIGDASGIELTSNLLELMSYEWFSLETSWSAEELQRLKKK